MTVKVVDGFKEEWRMSNNRCVGEVTSNERTMLLGITEAFVTVTAVHLFFLHGTGRDRDKKSEWMCSDQNPILFAKAAQRYASHEYSLMLNYST